MEFIPSNVRWAGLKRLVFLIGTALLLFLSGCTKTFTEGYQGGNRFNLMYRSEHSRTLPPQGASEPYGSTGSTTEGEMKAEKKVIR